jgi:uncharacterized small protein (DUF1192 family)
MEKENMKLTRYRLEASVQDVSEKGKEYLANEIRSVLESNKPYQSKADYIGYSLLSIDEKIALLDEEIAGLKEYKIKLKEAKYIASTTAAKVLDEYGITKIEGAGLSSITITTGIQTAKLEVKVLDEKMLIEQGFYKKVIDESKIIESYVDGTYKDLIEQYAKVNRVLYIKPPMIRVNKRKSANKLDFTSCQTKC